MQRAAGVLVAPDVLVDRLVTDSERTVALEPSADLLWAEPLPKQILNQHPLLRRDLAPAPRARSPAVCPLLRFTRAICAVEARGVSSQLTADRARMPPHLPSNLGVQQRRPLH